MASLTPLTVANLATTGTLSGSGTASTGLLTAAGLNNTGNLAITGTSALTGLATTSAGINVPGNKTVNFGSDQSKATNAGNIGYQLTTFGALDVYGAGTSTRTIKLWDNVTVSSNLNVQGTLTVNGSAVTGGASTPQPISMGIGSGTGDFSSPCTFYKDSSGLVHLQGQAASSSSYANAATAYYTFPSGYRPQYTCAFASAANGVFCVQMVYTDGRLVNKIGGANGRHNVSRILILCLYDNHRQRKKLPGVQYLITGAVYNATHTGFTTQIVFLNNNSSTN